MNIAQFCTSSHNRSTLDSAYLVQNIYDQTMMNFIIQHQLLAISIYPMGLNRAAKLNLILGGWSTSTNHNLFHHTEDQKQMLGKHIFDTIHPSSAQQCAGNMATLVNKQTLRGKQWRNVHIYTHTHISNDRHALYTGTHIQQDAHSAGWFASHKQQSVFCTWCVSHDCPYAHIHKAVSSGIWMLEGWLADQTGGERAWRQS